MSQDRIRPMIWHDDHLLMLDQRFLPLKEDWIKLTTYRDVAEAIRDMVVRGAPAIGIAAAYGMALAAKSNADKAQAAETLANSRPTAVNLFWAIDRIKNLPSWSYKEVLEEAKRIEEEDYQMNLDIGNNGNDLVPDCAQILTICNTGGLATAGHGTALGVIRTAFQKGKNIHVYSCETRPRMQGLRLTAYELMKDKISFNSIADGVAGSLMYANRVDLVIAGADRIAANGDSANKIGTYSLAVLAKHHDIPFYIAAPSSTIDSNLATGDLIPIEERSAEELTTIEGVRIAPDDCDVYNPAFDVTPGELISAIITEKGVFRHPYRF